MTRSARFCLLSLPHRSPLFCFWLSSAAMPVFSQFLPFFFHCGFRIRCFHCLRHRNKFVNQIVMVQMMHAYLVLAGSGLRQVSLHVPLLILQGMDAGIGTSNFFRAFLKGFFELRICWINEIPLNFLALSSFGCSIAHFCFPLRCPASDIVFHISGHKWSGLNVVGFFVSRSPDHVCPSGGFSSNMVNRVNPVHTSDRPRSHLIFQ